jgi:hypothetical protein
MLRVSIHGGPLADRNEFNRLALLDIAYQVRSALATYNVALTLRQGGEQPPAEVVKYPRWSASLWDLVARALTRVLYQADQAPPAEKVDRRCAYATRLCAVIERATADDRSVVLGSLELAQATDKRGLYTVALREDIQGQRTGQFEYGCKRLNVADLVLRSICSSLYGSDQLGPAPQLILPPSMKIDGEDRFHIEALTEPAKTGFKRYLTMLAPAKNPDELALAQDYVNFLMRG